MFQRFFLQVDFYYTFLLLLEAYSCTDLYSEDVRNYDHETFKQNVGAGIPHFINFFAPWCGYCKRLKPVWDELAEKYNINSPNQRLVIAKVDCTSETPLCADEGVTGYPSLIFYNADEAEGTKYKGKRDLLGLEEFITENIEEVEIRKVRPPVQPKLPSSTTSHVTELTDENFHDTIAWGLHFIKFYAPWCGHCQKLAPLWDELAENSLLDKSVTISKVDCTTNKRVCNEFEIKGYPTLLWIVNGKKMEKYQGERDMTSFKQFIGDMKAAHKELIASEYGKIPETSGKSSDVVVKLVEDNFENAVAHGISFVKFYAPWCGHSRRLEPIWNSLAQKYVAHTNVKIAKIDCSQNEALCAKHQVVGYPSLLLFRDGKFITEYSGVRKLEQLHSFVHDYLKHEEL